MENRKHIAKETILILGPQGIGNECMANMLDAHPELHVPGRAGGQSETGKFHFGYGYEIGEVNLRWEPPRLPAGEHARQVQHEVDMASQQIIHRTSDPPLIIGSHQFWPYTADIFTNLKIIVIMPRYSSTNEKHLLENYIAKNYERDKDILSVQGLITGFSPFMNGIRKFYENALPFLHCYDTCIVMFEDIFLGRHYYEYKAIANFLNLEERPDIYFKYHKLFTNYGE
tara:strand:+ start:443 stop:1126 length:684 start_codon:yes stop_codon:yes gene_type:complete